MDDLHSLSSPQNSNSSSSDAHNVQNVQHLPAVESAQDVQVSHEAQASLTANITDTVRPPDVPQEDQLFPENTCHYCYSSPHAYASMPCKHLAGCSNCVNLLITKTYTIDPASHKCIFCGVHVDTFFIIEAQTEISPVELQSYYKKELKFEADDKKREEFETDEEYAQRIAEEQYQEEEEEAIGQLFLQFESRVNRIRDILSGERSSNFGPVIPIRLDTTQGPAVLQFSPERWQQIIQDPHQPIDASQNQSISLADMFRAPSRSHSRNSSTYARSNFRGRSRTASRRTLQIDPDPESDFLLRAALHEIDGHLDYVPPPPDAEEDDEEDDEVEEIPPPPTHPMQTRHREQEAEVEPIPDTLVEDPPRRVTRGIRRTNNYIYSDQASESGQDLEDEDTVASEESSSGRRVRSRHS